MKHNDYIGLGCEHNIFTLLQQDEDKSNYVVFRLVNKSLVDDGEGLTINLISDDEETEDRKPVIENVELSSKNMNNPNSDANYTHSKTDHICN